MVMMTKASWLHVYSAHAHTQSLPYPLAWESFFPECARNDDSDNIESVVGQGFRLFAIGPRVFLSHCDARNEVRGCWRLSLWLLLSLLIVIDSKASNK